jgi:hypothetical protein
VLHKEEGNKKQRGGSPMKTNAIALLTLVAIAGASLPGQSHATSLTVCPTGCQYATIQSAINRAQDNDVIYIDKGHYFENLNTLGKALTLWGSDNRQAIIDGNGNGTVITIPGTNSVTVRDVTIMRGNGNGGGIAALFGAALNVRHSILVNNFSTLFGGGIDFSGSSLIVFDCSVTNNAATYAGGGIEISNGMADIESSTVAQNSAGPTRSGGGIDIEDINYSATVNNTSIVDNTGGGISAVADVVAYPLDITNSTIAGNSGSGVSYVCVNIALTNVVITRNTAVDGGGINGSNSCFRGSSTASMTATYVVGNSASGDGGGTYIQGPVTNGGNVVIQGNIPDNCAKGTDCP